MKKFFVNPRFALALLAGLLLTAAFPKIGIAGAAWVGPGLMLFAAAGLNGKQSFWLGFFGGLAHFLSGLYWLLNIPYTWHGIPLLPGLGWLALSAYCALYPALWLWLCWKICPAPPASKWVESVDSIFQQPWAKRSAWAFYCGVIWVGLEILRGRFLSGFPWNFLGTSQFKILPLIQVASVTGVYGVSFLVVWVSIAFTLAMLALVRHPVGRRSVWSEAALPVLLTAGVTGWGASRLVSIPPPKTEITLALVQPSIPQTVIWDSSGDEGRLRQTIELSQKTLAHKPDAILWPESSLPALTKEFQSMILDFVNQSKIPLILSGDDMTEGPDHIRHYFNSSFLLNRRGEIDGIYHKRRLVIFGEYVPLLHWLPFLKWFTPIEGGYDSGTEAVQFKLDQPVAKTSMLICFEDMFPHEAREHVGPDTDFLINLTNDGWFGEGAEQWQQAAGAIFRAVENGVPLVRCTNNGLTCWIDDRGRLRQIFEQNGSIYKTGFMIAKVPLRDATDRSRTIYNQYGDWFGWGCFGISSVFFLLIYSRKREFKTVSART